MATDMATDYLQALADALRRRDHSVEMIRDRIGHTVLKAGHPAVPSVLSVSIRCAVMDGCWRYVWEWGEPVDLPIDDTETVADRVVSVLGVTAK